MMTTPYEHQQLNAFLDGELDLKSQLDMEQRIADDPALRREVDEMRQLRDSVREHAQYHAAPEALRRRMATLMAAPAEAAAPDASAASAASIPPAEPAAAPRRTPVRARGAGSAGHNGNIGGIGESVQRWLGWRPLAASLSFAAVLAVAVNLAWLQSSKDERLSDDVVASHVRATLGQHLVDVSSSDHHTVKPFLSSKLGFSPPVDELQIPGSVFLGGRVDYLDGRPVAALVYKQGEHIVNAFVWPDKASDSAPRFAADRGFQTAHWTHDGMAHWVISDVNREEFQAVVQAVQKTSAER